MDCLANLNSRAVSGAMHLDYSFTGHAGATASLPITYLGKMTTFDAITITILVSNVAYFFDPASQKRGNATSKHLKDTLTNHT